MSSVIQGFESYREAARRGIEGAGGEPVLVNEDSPSQGTSSRNACLDAVDSCDAYILLVGQRGGWRAPSGLLVVEEEFERARSRKLPILIFVQDCKRDADAERLVKSVSDYVSGYFRKTFRTPADLEREIGLALAPVVAVLLKPTMNPDQLQSLLKSPYQIPNETSLRLILSPEREEEVIDPVRLDSPDFLAQFYRIGHAPEVKLLSYQHAKEEQVTRDGLIVHQTAEGRRRDAVEEVRLEIRSSGLIIIDSNVTGRVRQGDQFGALDIMVIAHEDIEAVLSQDFLFCGTLLEELDPYQRHNRFLYNVALTGMGYRQLKKAPTPQSSYAMKMRSGGDLPVAVFDSPKLIDRTSIRNPAEEIRRILSLLARHPELA